MDLPEQTPKSRPQPGPGGGARREPVRGARRGRLPAADREARQSEILDAAQACILEVGVQGTTMAAVATRANASKETLYAWFGGRPGLLQAVIERAADASATRIAAALPSAATTSTAQARTALTGYGEGLLRLLTSPNSAALNRAAMQQPDLARVLLASGRHRIGELVETYLAALDDSGILPVPDPPAAFEVLYGLVVRDTQIRVLLGEAPPTARQIKTRAAQAIDHFWTLQSRLPAVGSTVARDQPDRSR